MTDQLELSADELRESAAFLRRTARKVRAESAPGWLATAMQLEATADKHEQRAAELELIVTAP